jgi:hypothetical protein
MTITNHDREQRSDLIEIRARHRDHSAHWAREAELRRERAKLRPVRPEQRADYNPPHKLPGER